VTVWQVAAAATMLKGFKQPHSVRRAAGHNLAPGLFYFAEKALKQRPL
jgi:hypothetical protein